MGSIDTINIVPGNFCNLRCSHCVNESGPDRNDRLSEAEIHHLISEINLAQPKLILFTGGEPTLHLDLVNQIIKGLSFLNFEVKITTNGWFSKSDEKLEEILNSFERLNWVQLSYDVYHGSRLSVSDVKRLSKSCISRGIKFNITMCVSEAMDLIKASELSNEIGQDVVYQKVANIGRARKTGTEFKQPRFDRAVLNQRCANLDTISYIHGKGFTFCCGPLVFETNMPIAHTSIETHMKSQIRRTFENKTFGELLQEAGGSEHELTPAMSHPCSLCHYIQRRSHDAKS